MGSEIGILSSKEFPVCSGDLLLDPNNILAMHAQHNNHVNKTLKECDFVMLDRFSLLGWKIQVSLVAVRKQVWYKSGTSLSKFIRFTPKAEHINISG